MDGWSVNVKVWAWRAVKAVSTTHTSTTALTFTEVPWKPSSVAYCSGLAVPGHWCSSSCSSPAKAPCLSPLTSLTLLMDSMRSGLSSVAC